MTILKWLFQVGRIALGVVFLASGILKIVSPDGAATLVGSITGMGISWSKTAVYFGSGNEIVLGGLLLLRIAERFIPAAISIVLAIFTLTALALAETDQSCGCFGSLWESPIDEMFFLRNTSLLIVSLYLIWYRSRVEERGIR